MALLVLLVTRLLAEQHDRHARLAFAEHRLGRALVQITSRARGRLVPEFLPASHGRPLPGSRADTRILVIARKQV
jgi:hypothetical protein